VGSFDGGFGAIQLARLVGQKKAREIWYLCRQYDAREAEAMGLVNAVVPLDRLEEEGVNWAREILSEEPARNPAPEVIVQRRDGRDGRAHGARHNTNMLFYMTDEGTEGKTAFLEKRQPRYGDLDKFPWRALVRAAR